MHMNNVMVTGGAGFIGSHIVDALVRMNVNIISVDDYSAGKHENLKQHKNNKKFREVECDVTDYDELEKYMEGIDCIFHLAASKMNICMNDPRRDLEVNAKGTFNVLSLAAKFGVKKVVHASTGSVYGEVFPQTEDGQLSPMMYYGVSKLAGEQYAMVFNKLYDMDISVMRFFHVYGPRQDCGKYGGVISIFADRIANDKPITIFGDGLQERSFTYVKDVVDACILVAHSERTKGQIYNCASARNISVKDAARLIGEIVGKPVNMIFKPERFGEVRKFDIDNSKLGDLSIGFRTSFMDGLSKTVSYIIPSETPFFIKPFKSYDQYVELQTSALKQKKDGNWMEDYLPKYYDFLVDLFEKTEQGGHARFKEATALCLGARDGTEVRAFQALGSFCVGIDLNPGENNKYVLAGDASKLQFPNDSVDIVYTNALDHFLKIEETISEIKRVLRPNGRFILILGSAYDSEHDKWGSTYWHDIESVEKYFIEKHDFEVLGKCPLNNTNWFSEYLIFRYVPPAGSILNTQKGIKFFPKRTICEMLREIYDYIVIGLRGKPEELEKATATVEEAMTTAIKMTLKLVDYRLSLPEEKDTVITDEKMRLRELRMRLTGQLEEGKGIKLVTRRRGHVDA